MPTQLVLPPGRIVWGNPAKPQQKKDQRTRALILKDGKPIDQWAWGIAIPEAEFIAKVWPVMEREAKTGFPQGFPQGFSFKYKDGTRGNDKTGKPYNQREGYNGHYVLNINTEAFAPPIFRFDGRQYVQMQPNEIKCGDYVVCTVNFQVNVPTDRTHTPGLYVNPVAVLFIGYGNLIAGAQANPDELFGAQPQFALPPGASATPIGPPAGAPMMPGHGSMPGQPQTPPGYPPQAGPQYGAPPMAPQPQYGAPPMAPQYGAPPMAPQYGAPPMAPQPQYGAPPAAYPAQPQYQAPPPGPPPAGPQPPYQPAYDFVAPGAPQAPPQPGYPPQPGPAAYPPSQQGQPGPGQPSYPPGPPAPGYPPGMPSPR